MRELGCVDGVGKGCKVGKLQLVPKAGEFQRVASPCREFITPTFTLGEIVAHSWPQIGTFAPISVLFENKTAPVM